MDWFAEVVSVRETNAVTADKSSEQNAFFIDDRVVGYNPQEVKGSVVWGVGLHAFVLRGVRA